MVKKFLGYVLGACGLVLLSSGYAQINTLLEKYIPLIKGIPNLYLMFVGGALVLVGVFFIMKAGGPSIKARRDVPVRERGRIIEYRRE
jgi:ABC-type arginine transport system permease subunit